MVDFGGVVGKVKVIVESVVDEEKAKKSGKDAGKAVAKGFGDAGDDAGEQFSSGLGGSIKKFGPALAASAGAAVGALVVKSIGDQIERTGEGARLAASLGLDAKDAAEFNEIAADIYSDAWGASFEAVQQGVAATKSSFRSLTGDDLAEAAENAQIFADVFGIDVVEAATVASVAVKQGLAKDAVEAFDLMTAAAQKVPISLRDELLDAVTEYSSFFKSVGIEGPEAFALLAAGAEQGQYGIDKVGDAVKEFGIRATEATPPVLDAFKKLGLNAQTLQGDLAKGGDIGQEAFGKIVTALNDIKDPLAQRQAALALFGTPLEDLSQEEIPEFIDSLANATKGMKDFDGATKNAGDTAGGTFSSKIASATRKLDVFGGKGLADVEKRFGFAVEAIKSYGDEIDRIADKIADVVGGPLAGILGISDSQDPNSIIHPHAAGVRGAPGGLSLVGERGPELINLKQGADVYNAAETSRILGASGGDTTLVFNDYGPRNDSGKKREIDFVRRYGARYGTGRTA